MITHRTNPLARSAKYPEDLHRLMNISRTRECCTALCSWARISPTATPLVELGDLAKELGIGSLWLKDESVRSSIGSFKALGAPIALARLLIRLFPEKQLTAASLFRGHHRAQVAHVTVISATDGNHGRALAAAASDIGCRCVIVLHAKVSHERETAIAAYGAAIIRIPGNYDDSVSEAAKLAEANGWYVVSDTSYVGYEEIPRDVMQGYAIIADEIVAQSGSKPNLSMFTHLILQGGVGGFAAGVASYLWEFHGPERPQLLIVEPANADCLLQSCIAQKPARASGSTDSLMAGLACGECSPFAWQVLQSTIDHFLAIDDALVPKAMRRLAAGSARDCPIIAGESGAAGLAGLFALTGKPQLCTHIGLDLSARVLIVNTEGATSPKIYGELVGETAETVRHRQQRWQSQRR
jgi:diaminopropionate ammonia-lyase